MAEYILPRLTPQRASELMGAALDLPVEKLAVLANRRKASEESFAVLGRPHVDDESLRKVGQELRELATRFGYPESSKSRTKFDVQAAIYLHENLSAARGELLRKEVWQYFSCALCPDVVCWRWRREGKKFNHEHFDGGVRDCFGRLWRRADVLRDERMKDPWIHVRSLGEDNVTTIIERPKVARHRILVREASRASLLRRELAKASDKGSAGQELFRQVMLRLTRRGAHMAYATLTHDELVEAVAEVADATLKSFGVAPRSQDRLLAAYPELEIISTGEEPGLEAVPTRRGGGLVNRLRGLVGRRG